MSQSWDIILASSNFQPSSVVQREIDWTMGNVVKGGIVGTIPVRGVLTKVTTPHARDFSEGQNEKFPSRDRPCCKKEYKYLGFN